MGEHKYAVGDIVMVSVSGSATPAKAKIVKRARYATASLGRRYLVRCLASGLVVERYEASLGLIAPKNEAAEPTT